MRRRHRFPGHSLIVAMAVLAVAILACASGGASPGKAGGVAGKYVSEKNAGNFIELRSDGTFFSQDGDMIIQGKYAIEGSRITFTTDTGFASRGRIEAGVIDRDEDRWKKQRARS